MAKVAVIGLGRFGIELARKLGSSRTQVIAVDRSPQLINAIKDDVEVAVRLDSTDEIALASQDIDKVDVCVVAIGENFEAALLTTVLLKKLNVAKVICRAQSEFHAEIFRQIGADDVIQPETHAGEHLARKLANPQLEDVFILSDDHAIVEIQAPASFVGKSPQQLQLRNKYDVNLVVVKRPVPSVPDDETPPSSTISVPRANQLIQEGDVLVVVGSDEAIAALPKE